MTANNLEIGKSRVQYPPTLKKGAQRHWLYTTEIEIQVPRLKKKVSGEKIAVTTFSILEDNHAMQYRLH